jgi:glycosyltransferase involved in cell wall biosynthesis
MVSIGIVIPVYRCTGCLRELHRRLKKELRSITAHHEIIFVDDGDSEGAWILLKKIAQADRKVKAYRLSKNFGQHAAITAGLSQSSAQWVVVMDCDLQDPPEIIRRLYQKAKEGFDIVLTRRIQKKHSLLRNATAWAYFKLLSFFNGAPIDGREGSFSLINRKVVQAYLRMKDRDRHYLFILRWLGFKTTLLEYEHAERFAGESSYGFKSLLTHAFNGIFFQTTKLLRWIVYLGLGLSTLGFMLTLYFLFLYFYRSIPPGWTSIAILTLLIGGFIIASTGITGLYIGKIFDQVKQRPLYVFDEGVEKGVRKPMEADEWGERKAGIP